MKINIQKIVDKGVLDKERVVFNVQEDDLLGGYMVLKTRKTGETTVSSITRGTYWFPDKDVKKGDLVVLYTKKGVNTEKKNADGTTTHFYYWQKEEVLWGADEGVVLLARLQDWDVKFT